MVNRAISEVYTVCHRVKHGGTQSLYQINFFRNFYFIFIKDQKRFPVSHSKVALPEGGAG